MTSPREMAGRRAIVSGAGAGLGLATARLFAQAGASVVISDIDGAKCAAAAEAMRGEGMTAHALTCDVGDRTAAETMVGEGVAMLGGLDILLHNAGIFPAGLIEDLSVEQIERTIAINLSACFWLTRAALPALRVSRCGRILITSSVAGNRSGHPGLIHYGATKAGVNGFIRCAAVEFGPFGITVNGIEPGLTRTERFALSKEVTAQITATIPLGRLGQATDIAEAMLFLASDRGQWITGQTIVVDGGASLPKPSPFSPSGASPRSQDNQR